MTKSLKILVLDQKVVSQSVTKAGCVDIDLILLNLSLRRRIKNVRYLVPRTQKELKVKQRKQW